MPNIRKPASRPSSRPEPVRRPTSTSRYALPGSISAGNQSHSLKNIALVGSGVLIALCLIISFIGYQRADVCLNGSIRDCLGLPTPTPAITVGMVLTQLSGASELTTYIAEAETQVRVEQAEQIFGFPTGRYNELIYHAFGTVRAGVDLDELSEADIQVTGDVIVIYLPTPQLLDTKIDVNRSYIAEQIQPFIALNQFDPALVGEAQQEALVAIQEDACAQDILRLANDQAAQVLGDLLSQISDFTVQVITKQGAC